MIKKEICERPLILICYIFLSLQEVYLVLSPYMEYFYLCRLSICKIESKSKLFILYCLYDIC